MGQAWYVHESNKPAATLSSWIYYMNSTAGIRPAEWIPSYRMASIVILFLVYCSFAVASTVEMVATHNQKMRRMETNEKSET